jgi:DNA invertase Pin-like site-specific DNA recombinase
VRAVQRQLRALGHRPGPVDGRYGPRTQAAIERFQREAGQRASGVLSSATATALASSNDDRPARRSSASRAENSRADGGPPRADASGGSEQSRSRTRTTVDDRNTGSDGGLPAAAVLLGALVLTLVGGASLLADRLKRRRRRPEADDVRPRPVRPRPVRNSGKEVANNGARRAAKNGARKAAKNGARKAARNGARKTRKPTPAASAPSTPEPGPPAAEVAALGYVSVREPDGPDSKELREQTAAIDAACRDRGLVLKEVIRDLERVDDADAERPGVDHALRRLAAGDASCLVVAELGRLSRSTPRLGSILESLRGQEARLVSVDEGLDTATKSGSEAADKLRSLSVSEGRRRPPPRGGLPARPNPSALRERIREMRASGMTLQEIANRLNEEKVPTVRGGAKWRPSGVQAAGRAGGGGR